MNEIREIEHKFDLENLKKLQEEGKIGQDVNLEEIACLLPKWRIFNNDIDDLKLAKYGQDTDLDFLVFSADELVRKAVAEHGRDKDLDILVDDSNWDVRIVVAKQGRKQDLEKLANDPDDRVRQAVEEINNPTD